MIKNGGAPTISQHYVYLEKLKNGGGDVLVHIVAWCRSGPHDVVMGGYPPMIFGSEFSGNFQSKNCLKLMPLRLPGAV